MLPLKSGSHVLLFPHGNNSTKSKNRPKQQRPVCFPLLNEYYKRILVIHYALPALYVVSAIFCAIKREYIFYSELKYFSILTSTASSGLQLPS